MILSGSVRFQTSGGVPAGNPIAWSRVPKPPSKYSLFLRISSLIFFMLESP